MTTTFFRSRIRAVALSIATLLITISACAAATERVIDAYSPVSGVTIGPGNALFGSTG
jgi:hypothetical protein